jgi:hypothetical protein
VKAQQLDKQPAAFGLGGSAATSERAITSGRKLRAA